MPKINFVLYNGLPEDSRARATELTRLRELAWDQGRVECKAHMWVWPAYCALKHTISNVNVELSVAPRPDAVNFIAANGLRKVHGFHPGRFFTVALRADGRPFPYAHFEVVQNRHSEGANRIYIPHLPQPGLVPRDRSRSRVTRVAFAGESGNLFRNIAELIPLFRDIGLDFALKGPGDWHDLSDVDLLLGIRSLDRQRHHSKPPTKLFNAWHADIPFIAGFDSAYEQCGLPGHDYVRVSNLSELKLAIQRLANDQDLYRSIVENGKVSRARYTVEIIGHTWAEVIDQAILPAYWRWRSGFAGTRIADLGRRGAFRVLESKALCFFPRALFRLSR